MQSPNDFSQCLQHEWAYGVVDIMLTHSLTSNITITLCGDAGTGKSQALKHLLSILSNLGLQDCACFTATTHAAAAISNPPLPTIHSALGINTPTLLSMQIEADNQQFVDKYITVHNKVINTKLLLKAATKTLLDQLKHNYPRHTCSSLSTTCGICAKVLQSITKHHKLPLAFGRGLIVIDEMGMLTASDFEKIIIAANILNPTNRKTVFVLAGSVSQLSWPGGKGLWDSQSFKKTWFGGTYLWYNFRQTHELADALSGMQYNIITEECQRLLESRVIGVSKANDPTFLPSALRIFNSNADRDSYNRAFLLQRGVKQNIRLQAPRIIAPRHLETAFKNQLLDRFRPIFSNKQMWIDTYIGAPILIIKTQTHSSWVRGTITDISAKTPHTIYVTDIHGNRVVLEQYTYESQDKKCKATFYPFIMFNAINTYTAQGSTFDDDIVYIPPSKNYFASKILASAYVACSRVKKIENLWLASNSFAKQRTTAAPFFTAKTIQFKIKYELTYS